MSVPSNVILAYFGTNKLQQRVWGGGALDYSRVNQKAPGCAPGLHFAFGYLMPSVAGHAGPDMLCSRKQETPQGKPVVSETKRVEPHTWQHETSIPFGLVDASLGETPAG